MLDRYRFWSELLAKTVEELLDEVDADDEGLARMCARDRLANYRVWEESIPTHVYRSGVVPDPPPYDPDLSLITHWEAGPTAQDRDRDRAERVARFDAQRLILNVHKHARWCQCSGCRRAATLTKAPQSPPTGPTFGPIET